MAYCFCKSILWASVQVGPYLVVKESTGSIFQIFCKVLEAPWNVLC